jgi:glycerol-3-phosphate dehydrogenase (NAD(P)+)
MKKITVIGAGSWGTAISIVLENNNYKVCVWDKFSSNLEKIEKDRENKLFLPGIKLNKNYIFEADLKKAIKFSDFIFVVIPSQFINDLFSVISLEEIIGKKIVMLTKGIDSKSLLRFSELFQNKFGFDMLDNYCVLTGPSHAEEVGLKKLSLVTAASTNLNLAKRIQKILTNDYFRVYTSDDLIGAEIGGAVKNIIAIAAGITDGLNLGDNAKAALITRGLAEIIRFGEFFGGNVKTFSGLSGLGDLIVTCNSKHSRNYRCGLLLSKQMKIDDIRKEIGQVIEGVETVKSVYKIAIKHNIIMPITEQIYMLLENETDVKNAVSALMSRLAKPEFY